MGKDRGKEYEDHRKERVVKNWEYRKREELDKVIGYLGGSKWKRQREREKEREGERLESWGIRVGRGWDGSGETSPMCKASSAK